MQDQKINLKDVFSWRFKLILNWNEVYRIRKIESWKTRIVYKSNLKIKYIKKF